MKTIILIALGIGLLIFAWHAYESPLIDDIYDKIIDSLPFAEPEEPPAPLTLTEADVAQAKHLAMMAERLQSGPYPDARPESTTPPIVGEQP